MEPEPLTPLPPTSDPPILAQSSQITSLTSSTPSTSPVAYYTPARTLRQRASDHAPTTSPNTKTPAASSSHIRKPLPRELAQIERKLGPESVAARRDELIQIREGELKGIVEGHDLAVREKFHLERFISLLENYDPDAIGKLQVFQDYKRSDHNLLDLVPSQPGSSSSQAGPSRARTSLPSRQTRRAVQERSDLITTLGVPTQTTTPQPALQTVSSAQKGKGRQVEASELDSPINAAVAGKGKGRALLIDIPVEQTESPLKIRLSLGTTDKKGKSKAPPTEMLPPPIPVKASKAGRRATLSAIVAESPGPPEVIDFSESTTSEPVSKGKKRGRASLPNPTTKKLRRKSVEAPSSPVAEDLPPETPEIDAEPEPEPDTPDSPSKIKPPPQLPSLSHLPFPPVPHRPQKRITGPRFVPFTEPSQLPLLQPKHNGNLHPILSSYIHIDDTGPPPDTKSLEIRSLNEAYFRNRVNYLQTHGRLHRLLDETDVPLTSTSKSNTHSKNPVLPSRKVDHQDSLMAHMVQVRNAMLNEGKNRPIVCKRLARMVLGYWEHIEGKEGRERQKEERERKRVMKDLMRGLRKKWGLAVRVVRGRLAVLHKEEMDRKGKEHLQGLLKRSTGLLESQKEGIAGRDGEEEEEEEGTEEEEEGEGNEEEDGDDGEDEEGDEEDEEDEGDEEVDVGNVELAEGKAEEEDGDEREEEDGDGVEVDDEEEAGLSDGEGNGKDQIVDVADMADGSGSEAEEDEDKLADVDTGSPQSTRNDDEDEDADDSMSSAEQRVDLRALLFEADPSIATTNGKIAHVDDHQVDRPSVNGTSDVIGHDGDGETPLSEPRLTKKEAGKNIKESEPDSTLLRLVSETTTIDNSEQHNELDANHTETTQLANGHDRGLKTLSPEINGDPLPSQEPFGEKQVNGHEIVETTPDDIASSKRPLRMRKSVSIQDLAKVEDPDADDEEFEEAEDEVEELDAELDIEMEEEEDEDEADSEDEGLLADADLPIEELLKRYGYGAPQGAEAEEEPVLQQLETDKSLLDDALVQSASPGLIIEGKRQRRVRSVWTPEDNPPPPPKRPKIEEIRPESTPELSSDEEENDDDEDEEEVAENGAEMSEEDNKVKPPFLLRGTLRPYQQAGLEWLASLYANSMNGILADEMGLGKTIQTISLLGHLACDKGIWGQHLIIVPTSVILNWEMEFKKFLPGFRVLTYYGNQKERKEKRIGWQSQNSWQVCITSYQIVLADQHIFRRKSWVYMILDEAHNIKNFRSQRWQTLLGFKAQRRLLLTGTPLQNNLMELWSLLYFLMPGGVGESATAVVGFANHREFMEWFSNPMDKAVESGDTMDEFTIETISKLHTLLRPFILRRLKSEVETQLPGKFEHVVYCKLSKRQRFLYDEFMSRASTKEALSSGGYLGVVNTLMQLRKVCNHPDLFEVRPVKTSFAMEKGVAGEFGPLEVIVRKRFMEDRDEVRLEGLRLDITGREGESGWSCAARKWLDASDKLPYAVEEVVKRKGKALPPPLLDTRTVDGWMKYRAHIEQETLVARWRSLRDINRMRCSGMPIYGCTLLDMLSDLPSRIYPEPDTRSKKDLMDGFVPPAAGLVMSLPDRAKTMEPLVERYAVIPPNVVALDIPTLALPGLDPYTHSQLSDPDFDTLHHASTKLQIAFPDASLLQYDCGKLQVLASMLRDLKINGHRILIFTQMTRVLDILEMFLSYNGHRYLRLDGSTKVEDRQIITERFNSDSRIFVFIASSRSGGVGINLTGADTVFFYDSDWNPSMDRQCMDRAHRIGQTREVHIYRFVSSYTVEENMLKKANQKRLLDRVVIQEGDFTTDFLGKMDWRDLLDDPKGNMGEGRDEEGGVRVEDVAGGEVEGENGQEAMEVDVNVVAPRLGVERDLAKALGEVEDEEDAAAARIAQGEGDLDLVEFGENRAKSAGGLPVQKVVVDEGVSTPMGEDGEGGAGEGQGDEQGDVEMEEGEEEDDGEIGGIDEYMLRTVEWDWDWFASL